MLKLSTVRLKDGQPFEKVFKSFADNLAVSYNEDLPNELSKNLVGSVRETIQRDWLAQTGLNLPSEGESLVASWRGSTSREEGKVTVRAYTNNTYAGVHLTGAVITGDPLAIPMENAIAYWGDKLEGMIEDKAVGVGTNPPAIFVRRVTIKPKPLGSAKNYLELAAERFLAKNTSKVGDAVSAAWNKAVGQG